MEQYYVNIFLFIVVSQRFWFLRRSSLSSVPPDTTRLALIRRYKHKWNPDDECYNMMEEDGGRRGAGGLGGLGALGPMGGIGGSGGMGTLSPYLNVDTSYLQSESPEFIFNQVSHSIIIFNND